jgi:hypothetical protein
MAMLEELNNFKRNEV